MWDILTADCEQLGKDLHKVADKMVKEQFPGEMTRLDLVTRTRVAESRALEKEHDRVDRDNLTIGNNAKNWEKVARLHRSECDMLMRKQPGSSNTPAEAITEWLRRPAEHLNVRCRVCKNHSATIMCYPCRHVSVCFLCNVGLKTCPKCKQPKAASVEVCMPTEQR
jgi:hypothetical protein